MKIKNLYLMVLGVLGMFALSFTCVAVEALPVVPIDDHDDSVFLVDNIKYNARVLLLTKTYDDEILNCFALQEALHLTPDRSITGKINDATLTTAIANTNLYRKARDALISNPTA